MKKVCAYLIAAIAMMATGAASMGCYWVIFDEPNSVDIISD